MAVIENTDATTTDCMKYGLLLALEFKVYIVLILPCVLIIIASILA